MKKLIGLSLAALFTLTAAYPAAAQDNTILYDTVTKCKHGQCRKKVRPYEPVRPEYDYPRNIEVYRYNTYYGYYPYPYYGYTPFYGYPWNRDDYRDFRQKVREKGSDDRDRSNYRR